MINMFHASITAKMCPKIDNVCNFFTCFNHFEAPYRHPTNKNTSQSCRFWALIGGVLHQNQLTFDLRNEENVRQTQILR